MKLSELISSARNEFAEDLARAKDSAEVALRHMATAEKQRAWAEEHELKARKAQNWVNTELNIYCRNTSPAYVLAKALAEKEGLFYRVLGPFGEAEQTIVLEEHASPNVVQKTKCLNVRGVKADGSDLEYRKGGEYYPLPEDVDEVYPLLEDFF